MTGRCFTRRERRHVPCVPKYVCVRARVTNWYFFSSEMCFFPPPLIPPSFIPPSPHSWVELRWPEEMQALGQPQKFSAVPCRILMRWTPVSKNKSSFLYIIMNLLCRHWMGLFHMGYHTLHFFIFMAVLFYIINSAKINQLMLILDIECMILVLLACDFNI